MEHSKKKYISIVLLILAVAAIFTMSSLTVSAEETELTLDTSNAAKYHADANKNNPACTKEGEVVVYFSDANNGNKLDYAKDTAIKYTITKVFATDTFSGSSKLDTETHPEIKNENGYWGVCFKVTDYTFERYGKYNITCTFNTSDGKGYSFTLKNVFFGILQYGITPDLFDFSKDGITTTIGKQLVTMTEKKNDVEFTLIISLENWAGFTSPKQMVESAKLFWEVYPQEYCRFGILSGAPTTVTIAFENEGYEIASAGGDRVHVHDKWLYNNKTDYDCMTHELAHICQNGWDGNYVPSALNEKGENDTYMIERFVDYCRYIYAMQDGQYNDLGWTLNTAKGENSYRTSVRLLVWLDYYYGTKDNDIMAKLFKLCSDKTYPSEKWESDGEAWQEVFKGTELEGKTLDQVWDLYTASDFANLNAKAPRRGKDSPLLEKFPIRDTIKDRYSSTSVVVPGGDSGNVTTDNGGATTDVITDNKTTGNNNTTLYVIIGLAAVVVIAVVAAIVISKKKKK